MIKKNKLGAIAISQALILVLGILAFAFMIGSSIEVVSADVGVCEGQPDGTSCGTNGEVCVGEECIQDSCENPNHFDNGKCFDSSTQECLGTQHDNWCPEGTTCCDGSVKDKDQVENEEETQTVDPLLERTCTDPEVGGTCFNPVGTNLFCSNIYVDRNIF